MIRALCLAALLSAGSAVASAATWTVDPARSTITFAGTQTGTPFSGRFKTFTAAIAFDPAKPEAGHALVEIDMSSATTGDQQKDDAMPGADWFAANTFPKATFDVRSFKPLGGDRYEADGTLTIRDVTKPIALPFTLTTAGGTAHAVGTVEVLRSAFGVGQGAWSTDEYVAFAVIVGIDLVATPAQ